MLVINNYLLLITISKRKNITETYKRSLLEYEKNCEPTNLPGNAMRDLLWPCFYFKFVYIYFVLFFNQ